MIFLKNKKNYYADDEVEVPLCKERANPDQGRIVRRKSRDQRMPLRPVHGLRFPSSEVLAENPRQRKA